MNRYDGEKGGIVECISWVPTCSMRSPLKMLQKVQVCMGATMVFNFTILQNQSPHLKEGEKKETPSSPPTPPFWNIQFPLHCRSQYSEAHKAKRCNRESHLWSSTGVDRNFNLCHLCTTANFITSSPVMTPILMSRCWLVYLLPWTWEAQKA